METSDYLQEESLLQYFIQKLTESTILGLSSLKNYDLQVKSNLDLMVREIEDSVNKLNGDET